MLNKKRNNTHVCSFNLLLEKRRSEKLQIDVVTNKKKMEEEKRLLLSEMKSYLVYYRTKIETLVGLIRWIDH